MLAAYLLNRITTLNTKRRNMEQHADIAGIRDSKLDLLVSSQSEICRTCLSSTIRLRSIFCNSEHEQMSYKLKVATGLEIKRNDGLPQKICHKCLKIIDTSLNFRSKCREVERNLFKILKNNMAKSNVHNKTVENSSEEVDTILIKVEQDSDNEEDSNPQPIIAVDHLEDIKPNISKISKKQTTNEEGSNIQITHKDTFKFVDLPVEWEELPFTCKKSREIPPKAEIEPAKSFPKTPAERQKLYREKLKYLNDEKLKAMRTKAAEQVLAHRNRIRSLQEKGQIPPRSKRVRRPYNKRDVPGPPYKCPSCPKEYSKKPAFLSHVRMHTSFCVCEDCGKIIRNNSALQMHKRAMHGLSKIHKCRHCDYSAASQEGLNVHERRHRNERPYICDYCAAAFYTKNTLIQHIGVHLPPTIQCPFCPKRLRSTRLLSNHKAHKHGKRYCYQCPMCPRTFSKKYVRQHLARAHQVPRDQQPKIQRVPLLRTHSLPLDELAT